MIGMFATSKAGHDKGRTYVIVSEDAQYVYLADGELRLCESPKRKKKKHIQPFQHGLTKEQIEHLNCGGSNETIKRVLKQYRLNKE